MHKIVVADRSEIFCNAMKECAGKQLMVETCTNGNQALLLCQEIKPDVLVLDAELPEQDGLSVLYALRCIGYRMPVVMLTACPQSSYLQQIASQLSVSAVFVKPCTVYAVLKRIYQIFADDRTSHESLEIKIQMLLLNLNFNINAYDGSHMIEAVKLFYADPTQQITKETYPQLAEIFHTTCTQIERSLRKCIHNAWEGRDESKWQMYFDAESIKKSAPTNKNFLLKMASCLRNMEIDKEKELATPDEVCYNIH